MKGVNLFKDKIKAIMIKLQLAKMTLKELIETESQKQIDALAKMEGKLSKQAIQLQKELYELIRDKYIDLLKPTKKGSYFITSRT